MSLDAYPTCFSHPNSSNLNANGPTELAGPINVYLIWYSNGSHAWTNANKAYIRAFFNNIGSTNYWLTLAQYPDPFGRVPGAVTVAGECDDPESEGQSLNCAGGAANTIVGNHLVGGSHASQCTIPSASGLPTDTNGVYFVMPSWSDIASGTPASCHGGAQTGGGPVVQTSLVNYSTLGGGGAASGLTFYGEQFGPNTGTTIDTTASFTQPATGSSVVVSVSSASSSALAVGEPVYLTNSGGSNDYYTLSAINSGGSQLTLVNNVAFIGSSDSGGTTIPSNSHIYDLSAAMLPSLTWVTSHEIVEAVTDPFGVTPVSSGSIGWACPKTCSNTFASCSSSSDCGGSACNQVGPNAPAPGEGEVMDLCAGVGYPYGVGYASTVTTPTWTGSAGTGNAAVWGTTVSGTHYDFVTQAIFQPGAGLNSSTAGVGVCAQTFVPPPGRTCTTSADCEAPDQQWVQRCVTGHCVASTCSDGVQDGDESDIDCGGFCASGLTGTGSTPQCTTGKHCHSNLDCGSFFCLSGTCQ